MGFLSDGGGTDTKAQQVTTFPGPTPGETQLVGIQVEASQEQLDFGRTLKEDFPELFDLINTDLVKLNQASEAAIDKLGAESPNLQAATDEVFGQLATLGIATPAEIQQITAATTAAFEVGARDIEAGGQRALRDVRDILAPSRGLRPSDAPIQEAGGRIGEEVARQTGQLGRTLGATAAQAILDRPFQRAELASNIGLGQQQIATQNLGFQQELREAAFSNRIRLAALQTDTSLSLAGLSPTGAATLSTLAQTRIAQQTVAGTGSSNVRLGPLQITQGLSKAGGSFLGAFFGAGASQSSLKENFTAVEDVLAAFSDLDVTRWNYIGESIEHIGPMAEDYTEAFDIGDGVVIEFQDAIGILFAAVKELKAKIEG